MHINSSSAHANLEVHRLSEMTYFPPTTFEPTVRVDLYMYVEKNNNTYTVHSVHTCTCTYTIYSTCTTEGSVGKCTCTCSCRWLYDNVFLYLGPGGSVSDGLHGVEDLGQHGAVSLSLLPLLLLWGYQSNTDYE